MNKYNVPYSNLIAIVARGEVELPEGFFEVKKASFSTLMWNVVKAGLDS